MAHVLLVEDDAQLAVTTRVLLERAGYRVRTAGDGEAALAEVRQHPQPCVILLDLTMPVMTGWEFMDARRVDPAVAKVPVIVVSALAHTAPPDASAVLHKPFEMADLLDLIRRHGCGSCEGCADGAPA